MLAASSASAQVSDEDWGLTLTLGPILHSGTGQPGIGPAVGFRAAYGVHPLWNLHVEASIATPVPLREGNAYVSGGVFAGVSTALDVVSAVPWLGVAVGGLIEPGAPDHARAFNFAWMGTIGLDVRKRRDRSMGVQVDVIGAIEPKLHFARYVRASFRYTWMRSRGAI